MSVGEIKKHQQTEQELQNKSHDQSFDIQARLMYGVNPDADGLVQMPAYQALQIPPHDYIALTYVAAGDGAGEVETVTYKDGGSGGATVATLTLGYDGSNRLDEVTRT